MSLESNDRVARNSRRAREDGKVGPEGHLGEDFGFYYGILNHRRVFHKEQCDLTYCFNRSF
jgi:hypothetical protein